MLTILKKLFSKPKTAPRGLFIGATADAVVFNKAGVTITITPDLADKLAADLPRYAEISRALANQPEDGAA